MSVNTNCYISSLFFLSMKHNMRDTTIQQVHPVQRMKKEMVFLRRLQQHRSYRDETSNRKKINLRIMNLLNDDVSLCYDQVIGF